MIFRLNNYLWNLPWLACVLLVAGCLSSEEDRLIGRWEGRPDSAKAYKARQEAQALDGPSDSASKIPISPPYPDPTTIEQVDVRIALDFASDYTVTMRHNDDPRELHGSWQAMEASGNRTSIEIATKANDDGSVPAQRRRFQIEWEDKGKSFILVEEGADAQFGWFLFERP